MPPPPACRSSGSDPGALDPLAPLTEEDIANFVESGFLVKRGVLSRDLCARACDRLWEGNTSSKLRRDDPQTWLGGIPAD
eukprot:SAG31_NODE_284_length_18497_cov_11.811773_21_plen_79_part_01